jgi:tetratricopeptide (TPR) repeat protein
MPVSSNTDIVHNATTDHRILRSPQTDATERPELTASGPPLAFFHAGQLDVKEREAMSRELAIGLVYEARRMREPPRRTRAALAALGVLDQTLARWPDDLLSLRAKAQALAMSGRAREGFRIYDELLKRIPDYEQALDERVSLALELDDREGVLTPARRAVAVNPWSAEFHERLAHYQLGTGDWNGGLQEANKALGLNPFLAFARQFRIQCYLHERDLRKAEEELEILIALNPVDREARRLWFARERRRFGS